MSALHVVTGAGPVGRTVAEQLAEAGHDVRLLTRSGSGPVHPLVERLAVDVRDERALRAAVDGAAAVFHCTHAAYTARAWREELPAAEQGLLRAASGSVVVFPESLYAYTATGAPLTEDGPRDAASGKRGVRRDLLDARAASSTPTVSVAASDLFGPRVRTAHAGERMVPRVLAGRRVKVMGDADQPHSWTYVPDYARAMIAAAERRDLWGSVLHAPTGAPRTQRQLVEAFAAEAGTTARVGTLPSVVLRLGGRLGVTSLGELAEVLYQFERPFVLDASRSQALLGLEPTPLAEAVRQTVAWWRAEQQARDAVPV
jgi:nucleoside-diphosphate-sugar epimerase